MKVVSALVASMAVLLCPLAAAQSKLAGNCSAPPPGTPNPPPCKVVVVVPNGCGSGIHVTPDPIVLEGKQTVTIEWTVGGGWGFDEKYGIFIRGAKVGDAFKPGKGAGNKFTVTHINAGMAVFKYDVNLVKGNEKCSLDPTIVNY